MSASSLDPRSSYCGSSDGTDAARDEDSWPFHLIGPPDATPQPTGATCREISELLGRAQDVSRFSFGGAASCIPDVAGLMMDAVGSVPLPLCDELAQKIEQRALQDRQSVWTLTPDLVAMKNLQWGAGIQTLSELSSQRLGFKDVVLQPVLSKLLVLGAGGLVDGQKEPMIDRCVATMVVQLPSEHTGGDLVVREDADEGEFRYDMGKVDGTAPFKPQYAVYAAGGFRAVEEVTSGYCVLLVYLLCVPREVQFERGSRDRRLLRAQLARAIGRLKGGPDDVEADDPLDEEAGSGEENAMLALMLPKAYKETDFQTNGANALSGLEKDRLQLLKDANALLPPGKQLVFYLACLRFSTTFWSNDPAQNRAIEDSSWYSITGQWICKAPTSWTQTFNFLNPDNETRLQLWGIGPKNMGYGERCALIGWPASTDIANALALMGEIPSIPIITAHSFVSISTLRKLLKGDGNRHGYYTFAQNLKQAKKQGELLPLCQKIVRAILESGDVTLLEALFKKYVALLKDHEKSLLLLWVPAMVDKLGWGDVSATVLSAIDVKSNEARFARALELADTLRGNSAARSALVMFAIKKARMWCKSQAGAFTSSVNVAALIKHATACEDPQVFATLSNLLQEISGKDLRPVLDALLKGANQSHSPEYRATLSCIATLRRQWLIDEIEDSKKPFTWEMTSTTFPDAEEIMTFLGGPDATFKICGFSRINDARVRADLLRDKINGPIKITAEGRGREAFVQVVKAGGDFDMRRKEVPNYRAEIDRLGQLVVAQLPQDENVSAANIGTNYGTSTLGRKRLRDEVGEYDAE